MTDEEIHALVDEFNRKVSLDPEIRSVMQKIRNQEADLNDTSRLCLRRSELMGQFMQDKLPDLAPGDRERLCTALLRNGYDVTNEVVPDALRAQDERLGLHLNPVRAPFPQERVQKVSHSLEDPGITEEQRSRRAGAPVANTGMSFHDDSVKENARIRAKLGFKCYLNRVAASGCCKWCTDIAGRYVYGDHPDDIFRRHDNCGCTVTFENGRQRQDVWSKQTWQASPAEILAQYRGTARLSREQAKKLQDSQLKLLTKPGKGSIINYAKVIDSMFYADDYEQKTYTKEEIIEHLKTSAVGLEAIQYLEDNPQVKVKLSEDKETSNRGSHEKDLLTIWLSNCPNVRVAAQTVVHEVTHHRYGIGGSQKAETICFAFEKMHKENRKYLTQEEWNTLVETVKRAYWNLPANGGVDDLERFDFIVKKE